MNSVPIGAAWVVTAILVEAAIIDARKLRVPNWLTYHLALGGLAFASWSGGWSGFLASIGGLTVGLLLLLPLYAIGGMGAGDVKLLAGIGAWFGPSITLGAFTVSALVGGLMAVVMVYRSGRWRHHFGQFKRIGGDIIANPNPAQLAAAAAIRKPTMLLLPYGVPLAIGSIGYFAWLGLLF
jgi:prepilin peptidase CpaA